tara:strand:+ start:205 stop:552 length:348 start_codon:yes stop_codon:yes gene_type:complete
MKMHSSGKMSHFTTGAVRDAMDGKGLPSHMPTSALRAASRRFEEGAEKYGSGNWEKGIPLSRYIDSIYRHLWDFMEGDEEEDHLSAVMWNAMCLYETKEKIDEESLPSSLNDIDV